MKKNKLGAHDVKLTYSNMKTSQKLSYFFLLVTRDNISKKSINFSKYM